MLRYITAFSALARLCLGSSHHGPNQNVEILETDVAIIGGGSAGTHSAIRLQEMNKSVTLIEKQGLLGGHVDTYVDEATGQTLDYGVIVYDGNSPVVNHYFECLNVSTKSLSFAGATTIYADFDSGEQVSASAVSQGNLTEGFLKYVALLAKYPYLGNGFDLPSPVPEDLLLSWGDFVEKYDLGSVVYELWDYNQGVGNVLAQPALYMLKYFPTSTVLAASTGGFITTSDNDNQEIYDKALAKLGKNVLLDSDVVKVERGCERGGHGMEGHGAEGHGVKVHVATPNGLKIIKASKLLVTIPPKLESLPFLDLSENEHDLFAQFNNSYYWDMVLKDSGLPDNISVSNADPAAPYSLPAFPNVYGSTATSISGLRKMYYSSPYSMTDDQVKAAVLAANARVVEGLGYSIANVTPTFVGFNAHNPFMPTVCTEAIRDGFYDKLNALQGSCDTWWTGATWQTQDSSQIWDFTEHNVLPGLVKSLSK